MHTLGHMTQMDTYTFLHTEDIFMHIVVIMSRHAAAIIAARFLLTAAEHTPAPMQALGTICLLEH